MVILIVSLVLIITAQFVLLVLAGQRIEAILSDEHDACVKRTLAMFHYNNDRVAADALRAAAERWDSVDEKPEIQLLARAYEEGGPSVPAMWLRKRADLLHFSADNPT